MGVRTLISASNALFSALAKGGRKVSVPSSSTSSVYMAGRWGKGRWYRRVSVAEKKIEGVNQNEDRVPYVCHKRASHVYLESIVSHIGNRGKREFARDQIVGAALSGEHPGISRQLWSCSDSSQRVSWIASSRARYSPRHPPPNPRISPRRSLVRPKKKKAWTGRDPKMREGAVKVSLMSSPPLPF